MTVFSCVIRRMDGTGRSSPIWEISNAAMHAEERPRTNELARPKKVHGEYEALKTLPTSVSKNSKRARASTRIEKLALPKSRKDIEIRDPKWAVSTAAMKAVPKQRILELAQAKQHATGYQEPLQSYRPVSRPALKSAATERIKILARPITRGATVG